MAVVEAAPAKPVSGAKVLATPAARRLARDKGIDLAQVRGSGEGDMVTREDLLRFLEEKPAPEVMVPERVKASPRARRLAQERGMDLSQARGTGPQGRITDSFTSTPHFYLTIEAEATKLVELRERLRPIVGEKAGVRLTFTDILIALVAKVLRDHPLANASWEEGRIRIWKEINIGLATAVEEGLVVPVIKKADEKGLAQVARERKELADKAAEGKLRLEEVEGGTFTLTNLGMFGVDEFGAIINPPQSAILAVGGIAQRPVVEEAQVVARPTIRLTLSLDHRVLDGAEGARFLSDLKALIEEPEEDFSLLPGIAS